MQIALYSGMKWCREVESASLQCLWKSFIFGFKNNDINEKRWNSKQCCYYDTQEWSGTCKKLKTCNDKKNTNLGEQYMKH